MSGKSEEMPQEIVGTKGRARLGLLAALVVLLVAAGGAIFFAFSGQDSEAEDQEVEQPGFEEPYVASEEPEEVAVEAAPEEVAVEAAEEFDPETWDGEFRELSEEEIREALHRSLAEHDPEEYDDAVREVEMSMRRAVNQLEPERRREFALNFDRAAMTRVLMDVLKDHVDEETYEETAEAMDYWQDGEWRQE